MMGYWAYICICTCVYVHIHMYIYTCTYTCGPTYCIKQVCMHAHTRTHARARAHTHTHIHTHLRPLALSARPRETGLLQVEQNREFPFKPPLLHQKDWPLSKRNVGSLRGYSHTVWYHRLHPALFWTSHKIQARRHPRPLDRILLGIPTAALSRAIGDEATVTQAAHVPGSWII